MKIFSYLCTVKHLIVNIMSDIKETTSMENVMADFSMFTSADTFESMVNLRNSTVLECIDEYCNHKGKNPRTIRKQYSQLRGHIINLEKKHGITLMPVMIGDMFWTQFTTYMYGRGLAPATISAMISKLSCVMKWSSKYGARVSPTLEEVKLDDTPSKPKVTLTQDEVSRITYFDIDSLNVRSQCKRTLKRVRDQFVLACFFGQRYSDMKRIDPDCFKSATLFSITQQKTGNRAVVDFKEIVPYPQVVTEILKRYDYCAPYPMTVNAYNRHLHELFKLAKFDREVIYEVKQNGKLVTRTYKLYDLITSHTARRTMITNAVQRGLHSEKVRRASGHKSENAFARYIVWNDQYEL